MSDERSNHPLNNPPPGQHPLSDRPPENAQWQALNPARLLPQIASTHYYVNSPKCDKFQ